MSDLPWLEFQLRKERPLETLEADTACTTCGYNLRGLRIDRVCPECGVSILQSLRGDYLKYADPKWVGLVAIGALLVTCHVAASILSVCGLTSVAVLAARGANLDLMPSIMTVAIASCGFAGTMLLTWREPRTVGENESLNLRVVLRLLAVLAFGGQLCAMALQWSGAGGIAEIIPPIAMLLQYGGYVCQIVYLRQFAKRLPDEDLLRQLNALLHGLIIVPAIITVTTIFLILMSGPRIVAVGTCATILMFVVWAIWYLAILAKMSQELRIATEMARERAATVPRQ